MTGFDNIPVRLDTLRRRHQYRRRRVIDGPQGPLIEVEGTPLLNFCSNDYLGLAADARLRAALVGAVEQWGVGSGGSHLVCGHSAVHRELEEAVADFTGRPAALVFSSGYAANMGIISALLGKGDDLYEDRLNHASLIDGGRISGAEFHWYEHGDVESLDRELAADVSAGRQLIVSDGVFSMDGDCCPLEALVAVAHRRDAWLMIDDAHGIGVMGSEGRGLVDPSCFTTADVPLLVGTFGKALGTSGAFVAGECEVIEMLVQRARQYIYTTALPSALAAATLASLAIVRGAAAERARLAELIARFRDGAHAAGIPLTDSETPIQPVIVGESERALALSSALEAHGILVTAIRPPTVPAGTARLRITMTAAHKDAHVDRLVAVLGQIWDMNFS